MKIVKVVIGANFGDEGKGQLTDYFASKSDNAIVVLHNGGPQRGHTVVTPEGYRHVFRHFGAGTYTGAATYIAKEFVVNPVLFRQEYEKLAKHGIIPQTYINPNCKLTTIYDMLINQVLEADRGTAKHGSCGVGVFETLYRNQNGIDFKNKFEYNPLAMTVGEFVKLNALGQLNFLDTVRREYVPKRFDVFGLKNIAAEFLKVLSSDNVLINFIDDFNFMIKHSMAARDDVLLDYDTVIFENGQGLLLDQYNDAYFPHLTPSNTGMKNPTNILNKLDYRGQVEVCYVTRTYMTRHGVGRFDTECAKNMINPNMVDMTNVPNPFQDSLRYGMLNLFDLKVRIMGDAKKYTSLFTVVPTITFTHTNEFDRYLRMTEKEWQDLVINWKVRVSAGITRENITALTRVNWDE